MPQANQLRFDIMMVDLERQVGMWTAVYKRVGQMAIAGVGWEGGDRIGYKDAYMFLMRNKVPVARATFQVIPGAEGYTMVNDRYMEEGNRYYDGRQEIPGQTGGGRIQLNDCPPVAENYSGIYEGNQLPIIKYEQTDGKVLETRNYTTLATAAPNITFQQKNKSATRITVIAHRDKKPAVVVYYDSLVPDVKMTSSI